MGGMGGGMGGMMGGGMGGMGGGMGGMGGGMFSVKDDRTGPSQSGSDRVQSAKGDPGKGGAKIKAIDVDESVAPETFWDNYFAQRREAPATVRQAVRELIEARRPDHVVALIRAALCHGQVQAWMYEAMGLAMQLDGRPTAEIERALMSAADFSDSPDHLMYIAQYLARIGLDRRALQLARQAAKVAPLRSAPYQLGLRLAEQLDDLDGIQWTTVGILSQAWPKAEAAVKQKAMRVARATLNRLRAERRLKEADTYQQRLDAAMIRDCVIKVTWTGEADVDLLVEEPAGTICSLRNPRTTGGGVMLGDGYSDFAPSYSAKNAAETYVCAQGFDGTYRAVVRRVWGNVTAGKVTVDVYTHHGDKQVQHERQQVPLDDDQAVVLFQLADGRRTEPLIQEQIANAVEGQVALNRAILAQQLSALSDSSVAPDRPWSPRAGVPLVARGAVGYMPVIIQLPQGRTFSVTGVISADRRYVRISPNYVESAITSVSTFTFAGSAEETDGGGTDGGGTDGGGTDGTDGTTE
ncbi:MAG: hypothetical protein A2W31_12535 [Planctomycetes bacterium RBG_16_64_10]|nr:MAG: hypothetical protein A2W31_12535 [Planctomycetes bacterium RBG_16_64_10]